MQELWDACREANQWLALLAWFFVSFRLAMMAFDKKRWVDSRALHILCWFAWISMNLLNGAFGSSYYAMSDTPANWTSGTRSLILLTAIVLSIWWPHPARYLHLGEKR